MVFFLTSGNRRSVPYRTGDRNTHSARPRTLRALLLLMTVVCVTGCASRQLMIETIGNNVSAIDSISSRVDSYQPEIVPDARISAPFTPRSRDELHNISYLDVSLDYVLTVAMNNNEVLRDLGGTILRNPETMKTRFLAGTVQTDPRFSMEAALSAFDAQLAATAYFNNNDQTYNNPFFAGGINTFQQDKNDYTVELSKLTATGSRMALRNVTNYDSNNAPGNIFPNAWDTYLEGELRKPLLQGGGLQFNRIAGPGGTPGVYNGVLIAKVNNDITQSDFELSLNEYVSNVINGYWDLYLAYRSFDTKTKAMNRALDTWQRLKANEEDAGPRVALAAEQYFRLKAEVDEALAGRLIQGTQVRNGSSGGTMRGADGVQVAERRLRLLIGMPVADGQMLRPSDEPEQSEVVFDWNAASEEAVYQRPELRAQQLRVRKHEMELLAAKNFISPRLDAIGRYRFRGFGDDLVNQHENQGGNRPSSAVGNMFTGNLQEWHVGVELTVPIGFRRAHLAVSNAEQLLCRARALQREQQKQVVHDLVNAIADAERAYQASENSLNRYLSADEVVSAYEAKEDEGLDLDAERLLDAQRRLMDAELQYFASRAEYAVALKNVHYEKGSLLSYNRLDILDDSAVPMPYADNSVPENEVLPRVASTTGRASVTDLQMTDEESDFTVLNPDPIDVTNDAGRVTFNHELMSLSPGIDIVADQPVGGEFSYLQIHAETDADSPVGVSPASGFSGGLPEGFVIDLDNLDALVAPQTLDPVDPSVRPLEPVGVPLPPATDAE
ncbi:MAG: TolC family protein [Planctomycetaceae bacterium]